MTKKRLRTYIDRYPAKMVARLADKLLDKYGIDCTELLDPFCGSGAVLSAGIERKIPVTGWDVNPYGVLLSGVKVEGFDSNSAEELCGKFIEKSRHSKEILPVQWDAKNYWFTEGTIKKYENLRYTAKLMNLERTPEGRAILLAYALSIRRCSKADQRSPKPFVSKEAIKLRKGRHFDPLTDIQYLFGQLVSLYGTPNESQGKVECVDLTSIELSNLQAASYSHVITSPPYINAQDYFRNSKLELYLLEGLLSFEVEPIKCRFIGTDRGELLLDLSKHDIDLNKKLLPQITRIEKTHPRQAAIVHRYLFDMRKSFHKIKSCLRANGILVIVGGDNLVGGYRILTWKLLNRLLEMQGFRLFDQFGDQIDRRNVPPQRNGHKGLMKQEVISAFRLDSR